MATYNKNKILPNTLYSIARQKTSFPLEICIIDDHSNVDPEPIIKKFLPQSKYRRLGKNVGQQSKSLCLDMVSKDSEIVIPINADVIISDPFGIKKLCEHVKYKQIALAEVINVFVDSSLYSNANKFNEFIDTIDDNWASYLKPKIIKGEFPDNCSYVSRFVPHRWLFFLGAISRENIEEVGYKENSCDAVLAPKMKAMGFKAHLLIHVHGIHQRHKKVIYPCPLEKTCKFYCSRTKKRNRKDKFYNKKAIIIG